MEFLNEIVAFMDGANNVLSTVLSLLALIPTTIKGVELVRNILNDLEVAKGNEGEVVDPGNPKSQVFSTSNLLDLAFVLICATLFSLLLIDSFIVSGRSPTGFISSFITSLAITAGTVVVLLMMWYRGKTELGIASGATFTLMALVFAPGGPFISGNPGGANGLELGIPVLCLVFITTTMWIYEIGYPFDTSTPRNNRLLVQGIGFVILAVAILALGRQFLDQVESDQNIPKISGPVRKTLTQLDENKWNVAQARIFYQAASETYLEAEYLNYRNGHLSELANISPEVSFAKVVPVLESDGFEATEAQELIEHILTLKTDTDKLEYLRSNGITSRAAIAVVYITNTTSRPPKYERLDKIFDKFEPLEPSQQLSYLARRLSWIHPVGEAGTYQPVIDLPGIKPEDRHINLAKLRLSPVLDELRLSPVLNELPPDLQTELLSEFSQEFDNLRYESLNYGIDPPDPSSESEPKSRPDIFPELGSQPHIPYLHQQLSLPPKYEASLAYQEYKHTAQQIVLSELTVEQPSTITATQEIFNGIDALAPKLREAFTTYLMKLDNREGNFQALQALNNLDLSYLSASGSSVAPSLARHLRQATIDPDYEFAELVSEIKSSATEDQIQKISALLDYPDSISLFHKDVSALVSHLAAFNKDNRERMYMAVSSPVKLVILNLIKEGELLDQKANPQDKSDLIMNFTNTYTSFTGLEPEQQYDFLHQMALDLYQPKGPFAPNSLSLMVAQARRWTDVAGLVVASLIISPLVILAAFLGLQAAQRLTARDRLRSIMISEATRQDRRKHTIGTMDLIRGRAPIIRRLRNLAGRGWSSIAVVGRRGVGKTRILYELMQPDQSNNQPATISAWISAPSKFGEEEFVQSVFERLTTDAERAVARFLGAKPLEVRRLETNALLTGSAIYVAILFILSVTFTNMSLDRVNGAIVISWFPVLIAFALSLAMMIIYATKTQPVNLTPWLERDRSKNPHTVLLYRETLDARKFLKNRRAAQHAHRQQGWQINMVRIAAILVLGITFLVALYSLYNDGLSQQYIFMGLASGLLLVSLYLFRPRNEQDVSGFSLMSLISEYRDFVEKSVYRIRQGALGEQQEGNFEVVVCIDELDKIVAAEDLRDFLRRMKAIFEIPGAYYYLSLSEDSLRALYLGPAAGKNEIDSTFDHIIKIPPIDCDLGEKLVASYLESHAKSRLKIETLPEMVEALDDARLPANLQSAVEGLSNAASVSVVEQQQKWLVTDDQIEYAILKQSNQLNIRPASGLDRVRRDWGLDRCIAAISFGIPRDIYRRCDELLAKGNNYAGYTPATVSDDFRQMQAALAFDDNLLAKNEYMTLSADAKTAAQSCYSLLKRELEQDCPRTILLALWVLALISLAIELPQAEWQTLSEALRDIGYRILDEQPEYLVEELRALHDKILDSLEVSPTTEPNARTDGNVRVFA